MSKQILDQAMKTWEEFLPRKHKLVSIKTIARLYDEAQVLELSLRDIDRVFGHLLAQHELLMTIPGVEVFCEQSVVVK